MAGGVPPHWKHPGVLNGRLIPVNADPQGDDITAYYDIYDPYDYSSTYLDHVFVLGEDTDPLPDHRFDTASAPYVEQASIDVTGIDLIRFCWYLRSSVAMPTRTVLVAAGAVTMNTGAPTPSINNLTVDADAVPTILIPHTIGSLFTADMRERLVTVSGMAESNNNGTFRISGVPQNQGRVQDTPDLTANEVYTGQMAILENSNMVDEVAAAATVTILGARWVARAYIDGVERVKLRETRLGRAWQRNYLAFNVSQLSGTCEFKFELALEVA